MIVSSAHHVQSLTATVSAVFDFRVVHHIHIVLGVALKELPINRADFRRLTLLFGRFAETLNVFVITPLPRKLVPTSFVPSKTLTSHTKTTPTHRCHSMRLDS
jgi:hypothetical protein